MLLSTAPQIAPLGELFLKLIPWLVGIPLGLGVIWYLNRKQQSRVGNHVNRLNRHMDAVEAKLDRLIDQNDARKDDRENNK